MRIFAVTLEKTSRIFGQAEDGSRRTMVSRNGWETEEEARRRAYGILKRDTPDENGMDWEVFEMLAEDERGVAQRWQAGVWTERESSEPPEIRQEARGWA